MTIEEITAAFAAVYSDEPARPVDYDDDMLDAMHLSHAIDDSKASAEHKADLMVATSMKIAHAFHDSATIQERVVAGIVSNTLLTYAVAPRALDADPSVAAMQIAHAIDEAAAKAVRAFERTFTGKVCGLFGAQDELVRTALAFVKLAEA
jgi:hypothetical protein